MQVAFAARNPRDPGLALTAAAVAKAHGHGTSDIEKMKAEDDPDLRHTVTSCWRAGSISRRG